MNLLGFRRDCWREHAGRKTHWFVCELASLRRAQEIVAAGVAGRRLGVETVAAVCMDEEGGHRGYLMGVAIPRGMMTAKELAELLTKDPMRAEEMLVGQERGILVSAGDALTGEAGEPLGGFMRLLGIVE